MGTKYRQSIWMAVLALVMAGGLAAQQDGPPIVRPNGTKKTVTRPSSPQPAGIATLRVTCDLACDWKLDGEDKGHIETGGAGKIRIAPGQHTILATSADGLDKVQFFSEVKGTGETTVNLELQPVREERLKTERAREEQARAEQEARAQQERSAHPKSLNDIAQEADTLYGQKRYAEAVPPYERACTGGNATACGRLGYMYYTGQGVGSDYSRAAAFDAKACDGGESIGCSNLGSLYSTGSGVQRDIGKARQLLSKGCSMGNQWGCDHLKKLNQEAIWRLQGNSWGALGNNQPYRIQVNGDRVYIQPLAAGLTANLKIKTDKKGNQSINGRYQLNGIEAYIGISQMSDERISAVALSPTVGASDSSACVSRTSAALQAFSDGMNNHGPSCVSENLIWIRE